MFVSSEWKRWQTEGSGRIDLPLFDWREAYRLGGELKGEGAMTVGGTRLNG